MSKSTKLICASLALWFTGCSSGTADEPLNKGILLTYTAAADDNGNCAPERNDRVFIGEGSLYAVRGESQFVLPTGTTEIPFQSVFKSQDQAGYSKSRSLTSLNYAGSCSELQINVTIEYCEYIGDAGVEKTACPDITVQGAEAFQAINLTREDTATAD